MALGGSSAFSEDGRYFCCYGQDGKLKIWETGTGILKQEYTPNLHLTSPCTCLTWMRISRTASPKKKRKLKTEEDMDVIALGTASGNILLYSVATGSILTQLEDSQSSTVDHLTWSRGCNLFSCGNGHIVEWSVGDKNIRSKWKAGSEGVTCVLVLPDGKTLLSASRTICWWNLENKEMIKKFIGHASDIVSLTFVSSSSTTADNYVVSAARGDRYLSAWSLNPSNASKSQVASFAMDDVATSVCVCAGGEAEPTLLTAVTNTGHLHVYRHQLNGRCQKPLKPKVTIQVASDTGQNKETVKPIPILGGHLCDCNVALLAYGNQVFLAFERIALDYQEKIMCIVRQDPRKMSVSKEEAVSKVRIPETGDSVEYVTPAVVAATPAKRIRKLKSDVPMEERLANLALDKPEPQPKGPPKAGNMSQLLIQGLHSKDKRILQSVLFQRDMSVIKKTVGRLPVQVILPLVQELVTLIVESKVHVSQVAALWLKAVLTAHASQLLANPEVASTVSPILGLIESRLSVLIPLSRLRGRLDLLVDQITESSSRSEADREEESLLVYQDASSSDEGSIADLPMNTDSDDHWDELSEEGGAEGLEGEDSEVQENELIDLDSSSS
ncbi:WD repeat-containing protein 43 [Anabrus simplex]|uniref:WD repeat-containing protein 43 n=1 Tax=Anabrus simplex TaxID=316456 RepID=UPI0035A38CFC